MVPDLQNITPKTITVIGKINLNINLARTFDVLPLFEENNFKVLRYKHEGVMRELEDNGVVKESNTEFKNSITMEIEDMVFNKIRAVKLYCGGIHMCGHRSISRAKELSELIVKIIDQTHDFIKFVHQHEWEKVENHYWYPQMQKVIQTFLPTDSVLTDGLKGKIRKFFGEIVSEGGLFNQTDGENLKLISLDTVMVNYSYTIDSILRNKFRNNTKEEFIKCFMKTLRKMDTGEFDIYIYYDVLTSPLGWSGSVPLKFVHKPTGKTQWLTLQMRRGTVINSGPNIDIMQRAVNVLYSVLDKIEV
jgi:hypothetical protein